MYYNDKYITTIDIKLSNGFYVFIDESATGKTRLCKLLKKLQVYGEPVVSYTYDDYLLGISLKSFIDKSMPKVIFIDRYDMYSGYEIELLISLKDTAIILVDCKRFNEDVDEELCKITMTADEIEVT